MSEIFLSSLDDPEHLKRRKLIWLGVMLFLSCLFGVLDSIYTATPGWERTSLVATSKRPSSWRTAGSRSIRITNASRKTAVAIITPNSSSGRLLLKANDPTFAGRLAEYAVSDEVTATPQLAPGVLRGRAGKLFYERGTTTDERHNDVAALTLVRFNLDWLAEGNK